MDLVHANLLYLLPLAGIPVLLHLLTLHRLRTVELSTFRFLFDSYVHERRRMKFLEALLAMLRTLFLLLLVLVCARPVVRTWSALFGGGSGRDVVMLVDCSASMNARTAGVSALERAKLTARAVAEQMSADDRLTLFRVTGRPEEVFSRFSSDAEAIGEHLDALETSPARANWYTALAGVFGPGSPPRSKSTVYLFTDCQSSGWRELSAEGVEHAVPEGTRLVVVDVGSKQPLDNLAVIGSPPDQHRAVVGLPLVLRPQVANYSQTETLDATLSVFIDEKEVDRGTLSIEPGDVGGREVIYTPREPGVVRGRFQIGEDRFPDDDEYLFTLSVSPQIQVLLINGNPSADPFENETLYLQAALAARGDEPGQSNAGGPDRSAATVPSPAQSSGQPSAADPAQLDPPTRYARSLDVREIMEGSLTVEALREASVVILANCGGLNGQHFAWLRDFVHRGGGLLIFPGERVNPDVYNNQFFTVGGPQQERLVWARLGPVVGDAQKFDTFVQLATVDYSHPVLSVFDDAEARYLTTANFYRRFELSLEAGQGSSWTMARFSATKLALVESRFGDGRVVLAAFPANAKWSNLALKPEFVPLLLRMVHYLEHRAALEAPSVVGADRTAEFGLEASWLPAEGKVIDAAGRTAQIEFRRDGSRLAGAFDQTALKGFYTLEVQGGRVEQPKAASALFAVNLSAEESRFTMAGQEELRAWLNGADLTVVDASAETQQQLGAIGDQREVWRYLLLGMFLVIGCEFFLATLGGRKSRPDDEPAAGAPIRRSSPRAWMARISGAGEPLAPS